MSSVISVQNISKSYNLKHRVKEEERFLFKSLFTNNKKTVSEEFWALTDISFEVNKGDKVGVIGRNGAGKSTLLKILSRIVTPTSGRIEYEGRVASLLEVGTGFHPELTGRENIYLNGSILGMSKEEITRKFDEIVAFSEVENFLDTPVKRYSSGMYVRLAFAVAAHLEPEILIVDEVLAVGDSAFQKKCLGKMNEISNKDGKTILFVSHNMAAIQNLCNKAFVLKNGRIEFPLQDTNTAVKNYIKDSISLSKTSIADRADRTGEGKIRFVNIRLKDKDGNELNGVQSGQDIIFSVETKQEQERMTNISVSLSLYSDEGKYMFTLANHIAEEAFESVKSGQTINCRVNRFPVTKGDYVMNIVLYKDGIIQDYITEAYGFTVHATDFYNNGKVLNDTEPSVLIGNTWTLI
ncbi:MAG TPA: ABC transporter ATP-binding protein [Bacteroidia bacterium]|nr:ABC transporter ATP-binding protein [Bacteroidia bacterium]